MDQLLHPVVEAVLPGHDQGIDALGGEEVEAFFHDAGIRAVAIGQQSPAAAADIMGEIFEHDAMEFVEGGHHQPDHVGEVGLHGGGDGVAAIAQMFDRALDLIAVAAPDLHAVEIARHRSHGDACRFGHVDDGRWAAAAGSGGPIASGLTGKARGILDNGRRALGNGAERAGLVRWITRVWRHQLPSKTRAAWMCSEGRVTS